MTANEELRDACAAWQGGRDGGSSPIRAAARVLTGTKHYFVADFIADYEREAAADARAMSRARTLLEYLAQSPSLDPHAWGQKTGFPTGWVGRGIKSGVQDDQILATLGSGFVTMPLWGLSLDREVALSFGSRFLFELAGPFPAIAAWDHSGIKSEERELIAGGRYAVEEMRDDDSGTTTVRLRFGEACPLAAG